MTQNIPAPDHPCWLRLASGGSAGLQTHQLGVQLLLKRVKSGPLSPAEKTREIHTFFLKYEKILGAEINQLASL